MKKYKIGVNLIQVIKNLYDKATSAVLFNSSIEDWFRKTAGVRQGCLLSPTLFNILFYILRISYTDLVTNEEVRAKLQQAIGPHEDLLTTVKRRKLLFGTSLICIC